MTNIEKFGGAFTALITPFDATNREPSFRKLEEQIAGQLGAGIRGLVAVGTTGESPTLDYAEHRAIVHHAVLTARKINPDSVIVAGTGSNSTKEAIYLTTGAQSSKADAALLVAPYYNKPSQRGLLAHFGAIAQAVPDLPLILYNIPGRCGIEIGLETVAVLAGKHRNIVGIKEAGGSVERVNDLVRMFHDQDFVILSGDDSLTLPFMALGAHGVISVVSNVCPSLVNRLVVELKMGNLSDARKIHYELLPLIRLLFKEGNPVGVKCAMKLSERDSGLVRLPLVEASSALELEISEAMDDLFSQT